MWLSTVVFEDDNNVDSAPTSPDSTPLDLSPNMAAEPPPDDKLVLISVAKADPDQVMTSDPDPERSADRQVVALAMVTDLTKATGVVPLKQDGEPESTQGLTLMGRKKQRKRPREDEKICLVCGDKALAHNFDAITCESCKAFFRRNALRTERMNCLFTGKCEINMQTRRFCPSCRLNKCFVVGMKADLILDDTERRARMEKVSENRAKRVAKDTLDSLDSQVGSSSGQEVTVVSVPDRPPSNTTTSPPIPSAPLLTGVAAHYGEERARTPQQTPSQSTQRQKSFEGGRNGLSTLHAVLTAAASTLSEPRVSPVLNIPTTGYSQVPSQSTVRDPPPPAHQSFHQQPPSQNPVSSNGAASARSEFQHVPRDLLPSDPHMYWRLSEEEKTLLTQLSSAYQTTIMTLPERMPCEGGSPFETGQGDSVNVRCMEQIFESSEKNVQQLINFVQRLGDFHMLREDDKIAVLQASCMRSMILRWTGLYVVERHAWLTRFGECSVPRAAALFRHEDVIQEMAAFCRAMKTILKNDVTLFVLTHCLILFDPREHSLVDRQLINTFRDKYLILLKHYLESEYSFLFTERYLQAVLEKVVEVRKVADRCMGIMKEFRDYMPPLTKQLFNLQDMG